ncbi:MAG: IreB family regulatory phosphoprotein [Clostridia bacterium]|nr:IreB family regulatory phosphoprotein [Clostridia bacterium]
MIEQTINPPEPQKPSKDDELRATVKEIYNALCEKGYDPARQIAGYILSEDPVYITNWKNARGLMARVNRDELLVEIIKNYLKSLEK